MLQKLKRILFRNDGSHGVVRVVSVVAVAGLFAGTGYYLMQRSQAATHVIAVEAESGVHNGTATTFPPDASGGSAVRFGVIVAPQPPSPSPTPPPPPAPPSPPSSTVPVPTGLRAFTGGDSIALTWKPKGYGGDWVRSYNVYRDGVKIAATQADTNASGLLTGSQYVDRNVTAGQAYTYQVQTIVSPTSVSDLTAGVSATHPASTTPVPDVVLDGSLDTHVPHLKTWFQNYGVPAIKTWYPKAAEKLAWPDYVPSSTITISTLGQAEYDGKYPGLPAARVRGHIVISPKFFTDNRAQAADTLILYSTWILMANLEATGKPHKIAPQWLRVGVGDYVRYEMYNGFPYEQDVLEQETKPESYYTDMYKPAANFLRWIEKQYDATYMRRASIASHAGTFNFEFMQFPDGRNIDQAWGLFRGKTTRTGPVKSVSSGKCLNNPGGNLVPGTTLDIWPCNGHVAQKVTYHPIPGSTSALMTLVGLCLEVPPGSVPNGAYVWVNNCKATAPTQQWIKRADGSILNVSYNRCLEIYGGQNGAPDATRLSVWDCHGGDWQKWTIP